MPSHCTSILNIHIDFGDRNVLTPQAFLPNVNQPRHLNLPHSNHLSRSIITVRFDDAEPNDKDELPPATAAANGKVSGVARTSDDTGIPAIAIGGNTPTSAYTSITVGCIREKDELSQVDDLDAVWQASVARPWYKSG